LHRRLASLENKMERLYCIYEDFEDAVNFSNNDAVL
jgi:hypothetical protein